MKNVTFKQAVRWAGNPNRLAIKLGVTRQAIHEWKQVIPELRKYQIHVLMLEEKA